MNAAAKLEVATLGGGCFWCVEAALVQLKGVESVVSGYAGGASQNPDYHSVCSGRSGHVEVVEVRFDPAVIDYRTLLLAFFAVHDPTTQDRQGNDIGTQYRSVIFTHGEEQETIARDVIAQLSAEKVWPNPIVTAVSPAPTFWRAEDYHQNYFKDNPNQPYCSFVIAPKVRKFREQFRAKMRS